MTGQEPPTREQEEADYLDEQQQLADANDWYSKQLDKQIGRSALKAAGLLYLSAVSQADRGEG